MNSRLRTSAKLLLIALGLGIGPVHAELADRDKPAIIDYDNAAGDDLHQVNTFKGHVILTKGTIILRSDALVTRTDPEGYQYATATADAGKLVYFREKREGFADQFFEGFAERIDYDGKANVVTLHNKAVIKRLQGSMPADEMHGNVIVYNEDTEKWTVNGGAPTSTPGDGDHRARAVLQPNKPVDHPVDRPTPPEAVLKPSPSVSNVPQ